MKKNKKLLLASIAAMGVLAMGVGATSTFAWYASSNSATATVAAGTAHTINTVASDVTAAQYTITVTPSSVGDLQLTNPVETSTGIYKLQYGGVTGGKAKVQDCGSASGFVGAVAFTASWTGIGKPTQTADITRFKGKTLTGGAFTVSNYAKLINANAVSGLTTVNETNGTFSIEVSNDNNLELTVIVASPAYVRIQASSADANNASATAEASHDSDTIAVTAGDLVIPA